MIKKKTEELIDYYLRQGKQLFEQRMRLLRQKEITTEKLLRITNRSIQAIEEFLDVEKKILPLLNRCSSWQDVEDLAFKYFKIRGIGEETIRNWTNHKCNEYGIDLGANCESLITSRMRKNMDSIHINLNDTCMYLNIKYPQTAVLTNSDSVGLLCFIDKHGGTKGLIEEIKELSKHS
ncbi:MAG: hypothetical protein J5632_03520 [Bacteroidales bacterium]|nr:hypothetical protein [Bacteroidales bacterium]